MIRRYKPTPEQRAKLRTKLALSTAVHTNTTWVANRTDEFDGDARVRRYATAKAQRAGVSTTGKRWCGHLCRPGVAFDPQAWLPESDLKDESKRKCRELNYSCEEFNITPTEIDRPDPNDSDYQVSEQIVQRDVKEAVGDLHEKGVRVTPQQKADLTEKIRKDASGEE